MRIESLGYVGVGSPRAREFERFGPEILGTPLWTEPGDGVVRLRLDERAYRIAVHPDERDRLLYVGWEVAGPRELESAIGDLRASGVEMEPIDEATRKARHVEGLARFRDPWGLVHELFFGQRKLASFEPTRAISGFVTGTLGLGHVVLLLPDRDAAVRFFVDVMGFRVSDYIDVPFPLAFFHCNARHHSLAIGAAGPIKGLHHVMLELKDLDDVGTTYDLCRKSGVPFTMDLGRHSNDRMTSFYVRTPGGFEIEYGWGGLMVDDATWKVQHLPLPSTWGHERVGQAPPTTVEPAG
jgi:extradiol dioxygenase